MSDATIVSRGAVRFRGGVEWTRIDGVFGEAGNHVLPLGSYLSGNLNSANLPLLTAGELAAGTMADDPSLRLTAGQLTTSVDSRIASVPIGLEYGLTSRISVGLLVPIVQSRSTVTSQLNGKADSSANVGTNPAAFHNSVAAYAANAAVANGLTTARDQLAQRVADCAAFPGGSGCAAVNGRAAEANALLTASTDFTFALEALYGVSADQPGAPFVPIAGSTVQTAIDARLASLRASYASFGVSGGAGALAAAQAAAANAQFGRIVSDVDFGIGLDSIGSTQQTAIGDIELSVSALLFNSFGSTSGVRMRGVAAGVVRLGTGHPARPNRPFDVPTGDGQTDFEIRGALDVLAGSRLLTTVAGTFTLQTGSVETTRLPYSFGSSLALDFPISGSTNPGNMMSVRLNPRFLFTPALQVGALGIFAYRAADAVTVTGFNPYQSQNACLCGGPMVGFGQPAFTSTAAGLTIAYSNLASESGTGGPKFPAEIVFTHLETISASEGGALKDYRDTIELRYYFRTRR